MTVEDILEALTTIRAMIDGRRHALTQEALAPEETFLNLLEREIRQLELDLGEENQEE